MSWLARVSLHFICLLAHTMSVKAACSEPVPAEANIGETFLGGPIFTMQADNRTYVYIKAYEYNDEENTKDWAKYDHSYFKVVRERNQSVWVNLTRPLDLDSDLGIDKEFYYSGMMLNVIIICDDYKHATHNEYQRQLFIWPLDEYWPDFHNPDPIIVPEDYTITEIVTNIRSMIEDRDYKDEVNDVFQFSTSPYAPNSLKDGNLAFRINSFGIVYSTRPLDYEADDHEFFLNVTMQNQKNQTLNGIIMFVIENMNDSPIEFIYMGCTSDCLLAHYFTLIDPDFKGQLKEIKNGPIKARDDDGESIEYSIVGGSPVDYENYLAIDSQSGIVSIVNPVTNENIVFLNIVIQAQSFSTLRHLHGKEVENVTYSFVIVWLNGRDEIAAQYQQIYAASHSERSLSPMYCVLSSTVILALVSQVWFEFES